MQKGEPASEYHQIDEQFMMALRQIISEEQITLDVDALSSLSTGPLGVFRAFQTAPLLSTSGEIAVHPETTAQVASIVSLAQQWKIPVIPYGSGTGVMGGTSPVYKGILLDLRRLDQIVDFDPISHTITAQSGSILGNLQNYLEEQGFMIGHDPWSQPIASLGGAISTNGVGYLAAKYGPMGDQVLGLTVVLANGEVIVDKRTSKDSMGPETKNLFIGAEGTLGVITEATIRIYPIPEYFKLISFSFDSFSEGYDAILQIRNLTVPPSMIDFAEEIYPETDPINHDISLHLAFQGSRAIVDASAEEALTICLKYNGMVLNPAISDKFWETRHDTAAVYQATLQLPLAERRERHSNWRKDYLHVTIPPSQVLAYREKCNSIAKLYSTTVTEWSIWGKPEFFSFIIGEPQYENSQPQSMGVMIDELLQAALTYGGTIEYCHGVGLKLSHLVHEEQESKRPTLYQIKRSLDPQNILNPGKLGYAYPVIPLNSETKHT